MERHAGRPAEEFGCTPVVGAVEGTGGHVWERLDFGVMAGVVKNLAGGVDDADAFHGAEVDGGGVVDLFGGEDGAVDDVGDVGPIADLLAGTPDGVGVFSAKGAGDQGHDGVAFSAARTVDGEVAADGGFEPEFRVVGGEGEFGHELGPTVEVVGLVGRADAVFRQVDLLHGVGLE